MLILASASPRRHELLSQAGVIFTAVAAGINEDLLPNEAAAAYVQRLAEEKAQSIWNAHRASDKSDEPLLVLGADTCVVCEGQILGKPTDTADARPSFSVPMYPVITLGEGAHVGSRNNLLGLDAAPDKVDAYSCERHVPTDAPPTFMGAHAAQERSVIEVPKGPLLDISDVDPLAPKYKEWAERALLLDPDNLNLRYNFACTLVLELHEFDAALDSDSDRREILAQDSFRFCLGNEKDERETRIVRGEPAELYLGAPSALEVQGQPGAWVAPSDEGLPEPQALEDFECSGLHRQST